MSKQIKRKLMFSGETIYFSEIRIMDSSEFVVSKKVADSRRYLVRLQKLLQIPSSLHSGWRSFINNDLENILSHVEQDCLGYN